MLFVSLPPIDLIQCRVSSVVDLNKPQIIETNHQINLILCILRQKSKTS